MDIYIYNSLGSIYIGSVIWNNLSHSILLQLSVFEMWMQNISFIYLIKCLSVRTVISLPRHGGEAKTVKVVQRKINRIGQVVMVGGGGVGMVWHKRVPEKSCFQRSWQ